MANVQILGIQIKIQSLAANLKAPVVIGLVGDESPAGVNFNVFVVVQLRCNNILNGRTELGIELDIQLRPQNRVDFEGAVFVDESQVFLLVVAQCVLNSAESAKRIIHRHGLPMGERKTRGEYHGL
ncbi:hypothetical protein MCHI_002837 [Candidatus Magnetoovum chiemensis]|nr:hypothetical protein MCHI_002837 [Candidatus Magnetoovum chiemensis]